MKSSIKKKSLMCFIIIQIIFPSMFFAINGRGTTLEIDPPSGDVPIIDGIISSESAWDNAYKNNSIVITGPSTQLWIMQSGSNLYIAVDFTLDPKSETEFIGILIYNSTINNIQNLVDAKVIQFTNLTQGAFVYKDYYINNNVFTEDTNIHGAGAAKNVSNHKTYEFCIPLLTSIDTNDAFLEYENSYAFNITYGKSDFSSSSIINSELFIINIQTPTPPEIDIPELILFILSIVIVVIIGMFLTIYSLKIITLKKKVQRITR